jgi:cardiolipin synthase
MKRMMWLAGACLLGGLTVVAVVSGLHVHTQAAGAACPLGNGEERLQNPGFETATEGIPDGWRTYGVVELRQVSSPVHSGNFAAVLTNTITSTRWAYQLVTVTAEHRYDFSAWAVKDDPHVDSVYLRVWWYDNPDGSGAAIGTDDSPRLTTDEAGYRFLTTGPITAPVGAQSARAMLRIDPDNTDGDVSATFDDASFHQIGAPEPVADLVVAKAGPATAAPGSPITYRIALSNAGSLTATAVRVTDTLPAAVDFVTQTSAFAFDRSGRELAWQPGDVPPDTRCAITVAGRVTAAASGMLTNLVTATTTASETATANNTAGWTTAVLPDVRLYALAPANYCGSGEAAALINLGSHTVPLDGWCLNDDPHAGGGVSFPPAATIGPGQILWLAQDADGFYPVWGGDADWAAQAITRPVPGLKGSWPIGFLADTGDAAYLLDAGGNVVDTLAYGTGSAAQGWTGPAVPYPYAGYGGGQVLYRKLDQATGLPVPDTDIAAGWAQDPDDPIDGRKLRYPGWDLEDLFFPAEITTTANFTLAVAPEGALDVVSRTVAYAQHTLRIEAYTLESVPLYQAITDRVRAGVAVTVLLESRPGGGMEDVEKWIVDHLHNPPTSSVYLIGKTAPRYRFQHAKFILVDDRLAVVSSDNFGENSMPSDRKDNGTMGHRGFVAVTDSPGVVARLAELFRRDCDPLHHGDVAPYDGTDAPPDDFTPLPPPDWTTYTARFTAPLVTRATHVTLLHAPEHALRDRDSLLGLLGRARSGDEIVAMQMSEPFTWTAGAGPPGLNPRLQALVAAARRKAGVRILLDAYYDDPLAANENTAACLRLNGIAAQERLSLTCRLANVTGLGIHAKVFLVRVGDERWVHLGGINGTENSNKNNREVALQFRSAEAYAWMQAIFEHDWGSSHGPMVHRIYLPLVMRDYVPPADYPLIAEVFVNPDGDDAGKEWIELYNPGPEVHIAGWTLGDAIDTGGYGDGRYAFPAGAGLSHGQVIVAAACATAFSATYGFNPAYEWTDCDAAVPDLVPVGSWEGFGLALGNTSDEVLLLDAGDRLVDSAAWGGGPRAGVTPFADFFAPFPSGASLKRHPPATDRDDCSRDFYVSYNPSPGVVWGE